MALIKITKPFYASDGTRSPIKRGRRKYKAMIPKNAGKLVNFLLRVGSLLWGLEPP